MLVSAARRLTASRPVGSALSRVASAAVSRRHFISSADDFGTHQFSGAVADEELFAALVRVALAGGEEPDLRLADQLVAQVVHTGRELRGGLLSSVIEAHVAEHNWQRGFELLQEGLKVGPETVGELHAAVLALLRAACEHSAPGGPSIPRPNTAHPPRAP